MSLQVWLPLTKDTSNQGLADITVTNNGATLDSNGKLGGCYNFSSTYLQFDNILPNPCSQFSVAGWVKLNSGYATNNGFHLVSFQETYGRICISKDGLAVRVLLHNGSTNYLGGSVSTASTITADTWSHYAVTFDEGVVKVYINGQLDSTATANISSVTLNSSAFRIGTFSSENAKGCANDVRIYDHALSAKEVKLLSQGLVCHYKLDDDWVEGTTNLCTVQYLSNQSGSWGGHTYNRTTVPCVGSTTPIDACNLIDITYSGSGGGGVGTKIQGNVTVSPSTVYTYSCYIKSSVGFATRSIANILYRYELDSEGTRLTEAGVFNTSRMVALSDGWYRCWGSFTTQSTASKLDLYCYVYPDQDAQYYINCWQLEQKDHMTPYVLGARADNIVYDSSGHNYHGTVIGDITMMPDSARNLVCAKFVSNSFMRFTDLITSGFTNSYTFSWWGKFIYGSSTMMWGFADGNRLNPYMANNNIYLNTGDGNSNPFNVTISTSQYGDNIWHHFAITGDGTTAKLYIDGEFKNNALTYRGVTGTNLVFNGWSASASYRFNGSLSDFRIYATALSAEDIQQLYNAPVSISNNGAMFTQGEFIET